MKYIAKCKVGKSYVTSSVFDTREEAANSLFDKFPKVKSCSTSRASQVGGQWYDYGMNVQGHNRPYGK